LDINVFTDKDQCDLEYWPTDNPDWISLSFVQSSDDILNLKNHLQNKGSNSNVMAKIETSAAVENIDSIIEASDGIMVARGDLAAETPIEEVPVLQNRIINLARQANKPVIVATQMMDSMIHNPLPTRAEVTDVSTAILDGADAIMLSAETATGDHPVKVVNMMAKIAEVTESSNLFKNRLLHNLSSHSKAGSAAASITAFAKAQNAKAIVVITQSGAMARAVSRLRPGLPIIAITIDITIGRQLAMYHGVWSRHTTDLPDTDSELRSWLPDYLVKHSYLNRGDTILASFGQQIHKSGSTDTITLITI
jgi:pyruvate kinase